VVGNGVLLDVASNGAKSPVVSERGRRGSGGEDRGYEGDDRYDERDAPGQRSSLLSLVRRNTETKPAWRLAAGGAAGLFFLYLSKMHVVTVEMAQAFADWTPLESL
jgi:hypothetical protein